MDPKEQQAALAKALGKLNHCGDNIEDHQWENYRPVVVKEFTADYIRMCEVCGASQWQSPNCVNRNTNEERIAPDYLNDLNAMHNAILTLSSDDQELCQVWISNIVLGHGNSLLGRGELVKLMNVTAAQLACAFLKTLSLWRP